MKVALLERLPSFSSPGDGAPFASALYIDRRFRPSTLPACEEARPLGELQPERRARLEATRLEMDSRCPTKYDRPLADDDCIICGWPEDEHGAEFVAPRLTERN